MISVQESGEHRQEQIGAPGHLHARAVGQDGELGAWDQLLHQGAVLDSGEVAVAEYSKVGAVMAASCSSGHPRVSAVDCDSIARKSSKWFGCGHSLWYAR